MIGERDVLVAEAAGGAGHNVDLGAAVVLVSSGGGSGTFVELAAVRNEHGAADPVATVLLGDRILVRELPELHVKGLVGDSYALIGSMNLTHNGIANLTELLQFETDRAHVATLRTEFRTAYGEVR